MLAILNYHNVGEPPVGIHLARLYVAAEVFARQLWWLRRVGYEGVTLSEGWRRLRAGRAGRTVAITFDDGYADNVTLALPILKEFSCRATCFVVSERLASYNLWDADALGGRKATMTEAELGQWLAADCEVGSHTRTHPDLTRLSRETIMEELVGSRQTLRQLTGESVPSFCYPYGRHNSEVSWCVARAGYELAVTAARGRAAETDPPLALPRLSIGRRNGLVKFLLKATTPYADVGRLWNGA